jgi:hypothetical protein
VAKIDDATLLAWLFRGYAPYEWPQWRTFKVSYVLGLVSWWAYFTVDILSILGDRPGAKRDWMSPVSIAAIVLLGTTFMFLYKAYETRRGFRLHWEVHRPVSERQELAEAVRRTVGVTADQVADFRRWRAGAAAALGLFIVVGIWQVIFGPSAAAAIRPANILTAAWIGAIIATRFLWSTRTFGRIFHSAGVPGTLPAAGSAVSARPVLRSTAPIPVRQRSTAEFPPAYTPPVAAPGAPVDGTGLARRVWIAITGNRIVRFIVANIFAAIIQVLVSRYL